MKITRLMKMRMMNKMMPLKPSRMLTYIDFLTNQKKVKNISLT